MKNISKLFAVGILMLFLFASVTPVPGTNNEPEYNIVLDFTFSKPQLKGIQVKSGIYDRVTVEGLLNTYDLGKPCLPVKPLKILLPQGRDIKNIKVMASDKKSLGADFNVEVGSKLVPLIVEKLPHEQSNPIKVTDSTFSLFSMVGVYNFRGFDILHVNLHPVQYVAETGELLYYDYMKIIVETKESTVNKVFRALPQDYSFVQQIVDNPSFIQTYKTNPEIKPSSLETYAYVIITNEQLKNANGEYTFQDLAAFKEDQGLTTKIVTVEEIVNNPDYGVFGKWGDANESNPFYESEITGNLEYFDNTSARIRNFIRHAYMEWETDYILLGGDADVINEEDNIIPLRGLFANESGLPLDGLQEEEEDDIPSDVYYACLDGNYNYDCDGHFGECADRNDYEEIDEADLYAEVWVGRACVDSEEEVSNFVMKTISYQTSGGSYLSKILFIGEYLGSAFYSPWGGDYKDVMEPWIPSQYDLEKLYDRDDPDNNWNPLELIERLSDSPVQFINHDGHGNHDYILKMHSDTIRTLTNEEFFFIYSHSCLTGSFDNWNCWSSYQEDDCIAEILTAELSSGAYACILNARYGLGSEDSIEAPSGAYDESFLKALFTENIREVGPANHYSKEDNVWRIDENGMRWCYYQTNLFGDPHLSIKDANYPPEKPIIEGRRIVIAEKAYTYKISATDPEDDALFYWILIDGEGGEWYGPYESGEEFEISITWHKKGLHTLEAQAKDEQGAYSETAILKVWALRSKEVRINGFLSLLEKFPRLLSIVKYLFRI